MSKETDRATPRPWHNGGQVVFPDDRAGCTIAVLPDDEARVTQNGVVYGPCMTTEEQRANAALIVRAVNAHEALVEACEAALAAIGGIGTEDQGLMNVGTEENPSYETAFGLAVNEVEIDDAIELVKAALALARGE